MPSREAYQRKLERLWETGWLTNDGAFHQELGSSLAKYLGVEHLSLCCNGTVALLIALHAFRITSGEVITTPFTFPATTHALYWNRVRPVFCDVDEKTFNLDARRIEALIGPDTRAILPVHVFGHPCDVEAIQSVADKHGLQVIYDAAHVMGVRLRDTSLLEWGNCSILSFHATKLFSTIEGGAIVSKTRVQRERIDYLKNFGIQDEETVIGPGINGKMNEFQAAFGLLQLDMIDEEIARRRRLTEVYREGLRSVPGLRLQEDMPGVEHNYAYFPVLVDPDRFGTTRDRLHAALEQFNVRSRKYFYPLCSHYSCYASLPSAQPGQLPVAERVAERILCLPLYGTLGEDAVRQICAILRALHSNPPA
jgi:dTDP-4-amino-4,6-dideoxygalactose transaminase